MKKTLTAFCAVFLSAVMVNAQPLEVKALESGAHHFYGDGNRLFYFTGDSLWTVDVNNLTAVFLAEVEDTVIGFANDSQPFLNDIFIFQGIEDDGEFSIWLSDGTEAGTFKAGSFQSAAPLTQAGNYFYFAIDDGVHGTELWRMDENGDLMLVEDINPAGSSLSPAALNIFTGEFFHLNEVSAAGSTLYFTAETSGDGLGLYRTDGNSVTRISDLYEPAAFYPEVNLETVNSTLYFTRFEESAGPAGHHQLFRTDGDPGDAQMVAEFNGDEYTGIDHLTEYNNKLFFFLRWAGIDEHLWVSDGTEAGTTLVHEDIENTDIVVERVFVHANYLYIYGRGQVITWLWRSDGTGPGTERVVVFNGNEPHLVTGAGEFLFYRDHRESGPVVPGPEDPEEALLLWQTDGTGPGRPVEDIFPGMGDLEGVTAITEVDGKIFFTTRDDFDYSTDFADFPDKLWFYDPSGSFGNDPHFVLINAAEDEIIRRIKEGDTLVKSPDDDWTIAFIPSSDPASVKFFHQGSFRRTENVPPFAIAGDRNGDYHEWNEADEGQHMIRAVAYSLSSGRGTVLEEKEITFYIRELSERNQGPEILSFILVNAQTDQDLQEIRDGDVLNLSGLPDDLSIRLKTEQAGSVRIEFNSGNRIENVVPYSLFGDSGGDYQSGSFSPGTHILTARAFTERNAGGTAGQSMTIRFSVTGNSSRIAAGPEQDMSFTAFPNPFTDRVLLKAVAQNDGPASIQVFSQQGELVSEPYSGMVLQGQHIEAEMNAPGLAEGIYFCRFKIGDAVMVKRLVLIK